MSVDEIGGLKELFKKFDTDNSGTITFDELKYGLKRLGSALSKNEIQMLMDAVTPLTLNHSFSGKYIMILIFVLSACSLVLSATSQQYFSLTTNQPPAISHQYFSLRTNQHQSSATSQTNMLYIVASLSG
jgi:hypothetical protein